MNTDKICVYLCPSVVHFSFMSLFHYGLCCHKAFIFFYSCTMVRVSTNHLFKLRFIKIPTVEHKKRGLLFGQSSSLCIKYFKIYNNRNA
jgi:hypothetical protein